MSKLISKKTRLHEQKEDEIINFVKDYNESMKYWNIKSKVTKKYITELVGYGAKLNISLGNLLKIKWYLRNNVMSDLYLEKIVIKPLDFINKGLLTIKQALKIIDRFKLNNIDRNTLCKSIISDIIINEPEIYFEKSRLKNFYFRNIDKHCEYKSLLKTLGINWIHIVNSKTIEQTCSIRYFDSKPYYTLKELENIQKQCGDLLLNLYHSDNDSDEVIENYGSDTDSEYFYYSGSDTDSSLSDTIDVRDDYMSIDSNVIDEHIDDYLHIKQQSNHNFHFNTEQLSSIKNLIKNKFSVLVGKPGTGKTEVIDCVARFFEKKLKFKNICLTAPTGLATKNLVDRCKDSLDINHYICCNSFKLIKYTFPKIKESINNNNSDNDREDKILELTDKIANEMNEGKKRIYSYELDKLTYFKNKPDCIILDEASMITIIDFNELLKFCKIFKCRLILLGDPNQLPPIGKGQPLMDLVESNIFEINELTQIMRNSGLLKTTIENICLEKPISQSFTDNSIVYKNLSCIDDIIDYLKTFIQENNLNKNNTKFITPCNKGPLGKNELNKILQNIFNIDGDPIDIPYGKFDTQYRKNDLIIRTKNSYDESAIYANGDMACITNIIYDKEDKVFKIEIEYESDRKSLQIKPDTLKEEFDLSYALTVHKTQGSGFDNTVLFLDNNQGHNFMWNQPNSNKLFYTGLSRAKKKCFIFYKNEIIESINSKSINFKAKSIFMDQFIEFNIHDE